MSEEIKLLPCPFCGGKASVQVDPLTRHEWGSYRFVHCEICHAQTSRFHAGDSAIAEWNHRPIEDQLRAEIERMRTALEDILDEARGCQSEFCGMQAKLVREACEAALAGNGGGE